LSGGCIKTDGFVFLVLGFWVCSEHWRKIRLQPLGMPMVACISFPLSHLRFPSQVVVHLDISLRLVMIVATLSLGRLTHHVVPLNSLPKISLQVLHSLSPCFSFFVEIDSSFLILVWLQWWENGVDVI